MSSKCESKHEVSDNGLPLTTCDLPLTASVVKSGPDPRDATVKGHVAKKRLRNNRMAARRALASDRYPVDIQNKVRVQDASSNVSEVVPNV